MEGSVEEVSPEVKASAQRRVAGYAKDAEELREFLDMLGLLPGAPPLRDSRLIRGQIRSRQAAPLTEEQKRRKEELRRRKFLMDKWKVGDPLSEKELREIGKLFDEYPDLK